jgi:DNA-binding CsgD family transcriptional regulator
VLKGSQLERSRERLLRLCQAELDVDELRLELVAELKRAIGFAFWCWPLVDPVSLIPACALSEHEAMLQVFGRYMTLMECGPEDINGYQALARSRSAVGLLHQATAGDPHRSVRGRELYLPLGLRDELRAVLRDGRGCWGYLNLQREVGDAPFDPEVGAFIAELVPAFAAALRRSLHRGTVTAPAESPPGVLILDNQLRLRAQTASAKHWLQAMAPAASPSSPPRVPPAVSAVAARLLGQEAGVDPQRAPRLRQRLGSRGWVVVHAARLEGEGAGIAVTIEQARAREVLDLLCQAWGLSPREQALLELVIAGQDTGQIAQRLCISPHTVQDHLKAIFNKVGLHSRRELVGGLVAIGEG